MTTLPKFPGEYQGVLAEPLVMPRSGGLLGGPTGPSIGEQQRAKLPALFAHFGLSRETDDLEDLLLKLAEKHVRGFQLPWREKMPIKYEDYAQLDVWMITEAAALSCDYDPNDPLRTLDPNVSRRDQAMTRSVVAGTLRSTPTPRDVLNWCLMKGQSFPERLRAAIEAEGARQADPDDIARTFLRSHLTDGRFDTGTTKESLRSVYQSTHPGASMRAFDRAWSDTAPAEARKPGAKPKALKPIQTDSPRP